jgi:DNA-binding Lrp family transcriptional regulator
MTLKFYLALNASNKKEPVIKLEFSEIEKKVLNTLQKHFDFKVNQYADIADSLGITEEELLNVLRNLKDKKVLTRIGPFFNMDKSTGHVSLVAMRVPENEFNDVASFVNSFSEVAHNYRRDHDFNMWFVIAAIDAESALNVLDQIEEKTGIKTYNLPKEKEYALDLFLEV